LTEFEFQTTADDFVAFNLHHAATSRFVAQQRSRARLGITAALFVALAVVIGIISGNAVEALITAALSALIMWLIFPWSWRRAIQRNVRRMSVGGGLGTPGRTVLTADDAGLRETGKGVALATSWDSVERVDLTPTHVFVYFGPQAAIIVPRTVAAEHVDALLLEIEKHRPGVTSSGR
jgi:hypothetical protein